MIDYLVAFGVSILFLFIQISDYNRYKNFKRKKFSDKILFILIGIYSIFYTIVNIGVLRIDYFIMGLVLGESLLFYVGIAAIQRREFNFMLGGHGKGEGIKWIGMFWIVVSILWMLLRFLV